MDRTAIHVKVSFREADMPVTVHPTIFEFQDAWQVSLPENNEIVILLNENGQWQQVQGGRAEQELIERVGEQIEIFFST